MSILRRPLRLLIIVAVAIAVVVGLAAAMATGGPGGSSGHTMPDGSAMTAEMQHTTSDLTMTGATMAGMEMGTAG